MLRSVHVNSIFVTAEIPSVVALEKKGNGSKYSLRKDLRRKIMKNEKVDNKILNLELLLKDELFFSIICTFFSGWRNVSTAPGENLIKPVRGDKKVSKLSNKLSYTGL